MQSCPKVKFQPRPYTGEKKKRPASLSKFHLTPIRLPILLRG